MPNLNFTSSSFAQQDRYAQTTVSYESRHMQSIPFYPGVDHKAKLRGILAITLVVTIIVGALLGVLFGLRDYIIDWAKTTPIYSAFVGDDNEATPPENEEMNVTPAAYSYDDLSFVVVNEGYYEKNVTYNGQPHKIGYNVSGNVGEVSVAFTYQKTHDSDNNTVSDTPHSIISDADWPKNAGTYLIRAFITVNGTTYTDRPEIVNLTIKKASIPSPGLELPADRVYNASEKVVSLASPLPTDYKGGYTVTYTYEGKNYELHKQDAMIKDAGTYEIYLSIDGDENYAAVSYGQAITYKVERAPIYATEFDNAFLDDTVIYDGKTHNIKIDVAGLPENFPADLKEAIEKGDIVTYSHTSKEPKDAGFYTISAIINSKNYRIMGSIDAILEIKPRDFMYEDSDNGFEKLYSFKDQVVVYTGVAVPKELLEIAKSHSFPDTVKEGISIEYNYYIANKDTLEKIRDITAADIIDACKEGQVYVAVATFATGPNYVTPEPQTITITVEKADINLENVVVTPISNVEYTGGTYYIKTITGLPNGVVADLKAASAGARDAGVHEVIIPLIGGNNYNNAEVVGKITIDKAINYNLNFTAKEIQNVTKDGTLHLPKFSGELSDYPGYEVFYYVGGKQIEGIDHLGTYDVKIHFTDGNEYFEIPVKFTVNFNFLTILVGIVIGIIAALIIAPCIWAGYRVIEKQSFKKFARLRARILHERGGARGAIVCEGRVTILNWNSEQEIRDFPWVVEPRFGRLYLTHATIEYYDSDYKKNYRNQLIQLKDVTGVEIRGTFLRNKLIIFAKGGRYVYYVEPNTAYLWRRDILHFRNLQHLYPMENNIVDNDYPFNYTVITDGD